MKGLKFASKIPHYLMTTFLTIFLIVVVLIFVFIVAIKTSPRNTENLTVKAIHKVAKIFHIKHGNIDVKIENSVIKITIDSFAKRTAKIILQGKDAVITISLNKLWQGSLYEIKVKNFAVQLNKTPLEDAPSSGSNSVSRYYMFIPSAKMFIENFTLNLYGNLITLQDAKLLVNELHYVLSVQAHSKKDKYKISILLDRRDLSIIFDGISSKIIHKHTGNAFKFIDFDSLNGKIIIDTHNLENIQFSCKGTDIKLTKSQFVNEDLAVSQASMMGYVNYGNLFVKISDARIFDKGKADITIKNENGEMDVDVHIENAPVDSVKKYVTEYVLQMSGIKETFDYLMSAISGGIVKIVDVKIHSPVLEQQDVAVGVEFEDTSFLYNKYFPQIDNASGNVVVNRDYTTVDVLSGKSGNNSIVNSRAVLNHASSYLSLHLDISGSPAFIANTFDVKNDYKIFDNYFKGRAKAQVFIGINLRCQDVYSCTNVKGDLTFKDVLLPFAQKPLSGRMKVLKSDNKDMDIKVYFNNFDYKYFNIREISGSHTLDIDNKILEIKNITAINTNSDEIFKVKLLKIPFKSKTLIQIIDIPSIDFENNDFGVKIYNSDDKKEINIMGQEISIPQMFEMWKDFQYYYNKESLAPKQGGNAIQQIFNYDVMMNVKNIEFFNQIATPLFLNISNYSTQNTLIDMKSNLLQYHYHNFGNEKKKNSDEINLTIPDLKKLFTAFNKADIGIDGDIKLKGDYSNDGHLKWYGKVSGFKINSNKFKFNPHQFNFEARLFNSVLSFNNIKVYDKNHTIFITGKIFTDKLNIDAKAYYTPSRIELLNTVPIVSNAISVTTLGQNKNGLVSLEFGVYGNIFTPEIKFNKSSPIKSLWKFGIGVVFLPLLLL